MTLYPFLELEIGSALPSPNFLQPHFGEPSSGFTPGLGSVSIDLFNVVLLVKLKGHEFNEFNYVECNFIVLPL